MSSRSNNYEVKIFRDEDKFFYSAIFLSVGIHLILIIILSIARVKVEKKVVKQIEITYQKIIPKETAKVERIKEDLSLVKEKDVDGLVMKLEYLLNNPESWIAMGEAGREHVEQEFNLFAQVKKLEKIYMEFIN